MTDNKEQWEKGCGHNTCKYLSDEDKCGMKPKTEVCTNCGQVGSHHSDCQWRAKPEQQDYIFLEDVKALIKKSRADDKERMVKIVDKAVKKEHETATKDDFHSGRFWGVKDLQQAIRNIN